MTDDELKGLFGGLRQDTAAIRSDVGAIHGEIAELRQDNVAIRQEAVAAHTETRRHFDIVANGLRDDIRLVAESVGHTQEQLARTAADLGEKIDRGLAETQSMIRFSHAELDRRVRTLEESVADLQARVERLESSTH